MPANRYDLLCVEGLARAFRVFLGLEEPPQYKIHNVGEPQQLTITAEVLPVRKFMVRWDVVFFCDVLLLVFSRSWLLVSCLVYDGGYSVCLPQVSATLRGIDFSKRPGAFQSFLALQEKLHQNICRKRKLVSIGTHDLDKIQGRVQGKGAVR